MLESIDRAYNTNICDIIITGDFNYNMLFNNKNKISDLLLQFNLTQLITEATHFTETFASLIDLIMLRNRNNVLTSGVADPLLPNLTRYHCPVYIFLKFIRPKVKTYKGKYGITKEQISQNTDKSSVNMTYRTGSGEMNWTPVYKLLPMRYSTQPTSQYRIRS